MNRNLVTGKREEKPGEGGEKKEKGKDRQQSLELKKKGDRKKKIQLYIAGGKTFKRWGVLISKLKLFGFLAPCPKCQ